MQIRFAVGIVVAALLGVGCGSDPAARPAATGETPRDGATEQAADGDLQPLTLVTGLPSISATSAHVYAGKELGYYAEEGIDIEFQPLEAGAAGVPALLATGGADVTYASADAVINAVEQGIADEIGMIAICQVTRRDIYQDFLIREDDPEIQGYADLEGKVVGVRNLALATSGAARAMLEAEGVDPDSVEYLAVGLGPAAGQALVDGEVDALSLFDTDHQRLIDLDLPVTRLPKVDIPGIGISIITTRDYVDANRELIEGLLRALAKSTAFASTNHEAAIRVYHEIFPEAVGDDSEEEAFESDLSTWRARADAVDFEAYDPPQFCAYEDDGRWPGRAEVLDIDSVSDWSPYFTNEFVEAANDFDLEAIKQEAESYGG